MDLNLGPLVLEATAVPTVPQPLQWELILHQQKKGVVIGQKVIQSNSI